jgi:hypothetical protein
MSELELKLRQQIAAAPSATAWRGLAECELARGALDEAERSFVEALGLAPGDVDTRLGLIDVALWREGFAGWHRRIEEALSLRIPLPDAFHVLIRKACLCWVTRQIKPCTDILVLLSSALGREGAPLAQKLQGYTMSMAGHINGLVRAEVSGRGAVYSSEALPPLFLVGDSHCIAPAASLVSLAGETRRVVPLYVLGCKAWHLANGERNQYKECVERLARALPEGATVLFSAGDIDCRYQSGFHNLVRKTGADLDRAIPETVEAYLDLLQRVFPAESTRLMLLSPPAPRGDLQPLDEADHTLLPTISARFRQALGAGCTARGLLLIDYYAFTVGEDGWSNRRHHVDGHHLYADALRLAIEAAA